MKPILEDFVSVLDANGVEKRRISLLEALDGSPFRQLFRESDLDLDEVLFGDIFHTNTLEILDGRITGKLPAFRKGNIPTSILRLDAIAVVDPAREEVVWAHQGDFKAQHDPEVVPSGNVMLFDNQGRPGRSRVQEIDPVSGEVVRQYAGSLAEPFYSLTCGAAQRLPNGNTLVTESDSGRAFEVVPSGDIVWEFYNPHHAGKDGECIATLFDLIRLPPEFPTGWAKGDPVVEPSR